MKLGAICGTTVALLTLGACCLDTRNGIDRTDRGGDAGADGGNDAGPDAGQDTLRDGGPDAGDAGTLTDAGACSPRDFNLDTVASFAASQFYAAASGDVNRDGLLDLVGGSLDGAQGVQLLYGLASGGLSGALDLELGSPADAVTIGDLNGDGIPDIAAGEYQLMLFFNDGGGGFTLVTLPIPIGLYQIQQLGIGDFDGDGAPDLFVEGIDSEDTTLPIEVLMNQGSRGFSDPILITGIQGDFVVADLNRDGLADLVASTTDGSLAVLLSTGDGGFELNAYPYPVPRYSFVSLLPGESGAPDLVANLEPGIGDYLGIYLLRNSGAGTFTLGPEISAERFGATATGDFNGDCLPDVAIFSGGTCDNSTAIEISVSYGQGHGSFGPPQPLSPGPLIPFSMFPMGPVDSPHALGFGTPCTDGYGVVIYGDASH